MLIQVNTDNNIDGDESLVAKVQANIHQALDRFGPQITRVEVQLADQNSHKSGSNDKRCVLEARLAGLTPIAVSEQAPSLDIAIDGALDKLIKTLDRKIGRLRDAKTRGGEE